ncbi:uroporphyrinogen-III synthase [Neobacillus cucumis]|uniref:Uroporphyrinogen-III synthase n=1 Tax=Neobacillus cucumis TaxID=1740721 RepID=A0A2N5HSS7_9BACI|nr:uroporphyrinogen-III synthase [Neobacillus cucumis]PLS08563.1 uroporphyrinogen-III synthase [Neobacillus cucumis]
MEKGLSGKRIVVGGTRKLEEISTLIEKQGGIPVIRSLQGTVFLAEKEVEPDLAEFVEKGADWVIFTTGIGIETLINISAKLGLEEAFLDKIRNANVASRGYKSLGALKKLEIQPIATSDDGTTKGLVRAFEGTDFNGKRVMVQLHGETAPALTQYLEEQGAVVHKILPYQHIEPEEEIVNTLCREIIAKECDAVCFTTAVQARSLFDYARKNNVYDQVVNAFKNDTLAVAVGKVTLEALKEEGIDRVLAPENERMGAMIITLSNYYLNADK